MEPPPLSSTLGPMPGTRERPIEPRKKRLIVTCDGTWLDADNGILNGKKQQPSNVSRIGWAIKDTSRDGIPQVVHYQAGVGTMGGVVSRFFGGALGLGLKSNIREAYNYIATNYREGDEIFLMGFSRGAFTARSIGGMIGDLGLLTRAGLPFFNEVFEDYEGRNSNRYVSAYPDVPWRNKPEFGTEYVRELERRGLTRLRVPIKAVCCWDTVGALGVPRIGFLEKLGLQPREMGRYQFYDTKLYEGIENAFQALALDERRAPFVPALWEKRDGDRTNLKQVWFPGVHSNVGGGYDDQELSNITLAWMMSRLEPFLDFRPEYLLNQYHENKEYYKETGQRSRWWSFGEIYRTVTGIYSITGSKTRTPGDYYRVDPDTGVVTDRKLRNTNEYIHASVRSRLGLHGPGMQDSGEYDSPALRDWNFTTEPSSQGGNCADGSMVVWTNRAAEETGGQHIIPEAILLETEITLLRHSERVAEYIRSMKEPMKEKRRNRRMENGNPEGPTMAGGLADGEPKRRRDRPRSMEPAAEKQRKRRSRRYS